MGKAVSCTLIFKEPKTERKRKENKKLMNSEVAGYIGLARRLLIRPILDLFKS